ncbi:MAG: ATP-dependent protease subunit HslV, partial [Brevundimonas aurantiaca]
MTNDTTPSPGWHGTTIIAVRKNGRTVIAGDGQVSMGPT